MSLVVLVLLSLLVSPTFSIPIGIGPALDYGYDYLNGFFGYDYAADYAYPGYPRTVDYAKENFVRGSPYGAAEVTTVRSTRDEVTVRPSTLRAPYSRFYSSYYPYSNLRGINRYPFDYGYDYPNRFFGYDSAADYAYPGYPSTVDYAKENFVRGSPYGPTEVGTRDEVTVRPNSLRAPYSRFYSSYYPYNYLRGINRYPSDYGYDYPNGFFGYDYAADYAYPGYPSAVDYAKENFVRGSPYGPTEVGTRDEVTVRPNSLRAPYSRFYSSYYPYSYLRGIGRYPFDNNFPLRGSLPFGPYPTRSYLGRFAGDALYF